MYTTLPPETYLLLARDQLRERSRDAQDDARAVRLVRLRRREKAVERAISRARVARLAVG